MKYFASLFFLLLFAGTAFGQTVNFEDGFEDGDFTSAPTWSGDTGEFTVIDDTPNYLLQLNASTSPAYLSTSSSNVVGTWMFYIEFRGFEPSGSNQANIFLMSDIADLEGPVNGYAIQVGDTGDDVFHLVRYDSGTEATTVLSGNTIVNSSGGSYSVKVSRDNSGNWSMQVADGYGGPYNAAVTGTDNTYTSASSFGPKIDFTSSRSDKFYFDFKIDLPPFDVSQTTINGSQVDVTFNRPYNQSTVQKSDFSIDNGIGSPSGFSFPNSTAVRLDYGSTNFPSNQYSVTINDVDDQNGETITPNTKSSFVIFGTFSQGDIKINEFAYDPPTGQEEYVELINTSSKYLDLANWEIGDDTGTDALGSDPIILKPNEFLAISTDTTSLFDAFGHHPYYNASDLASFNNSGGDAVQLVTDTGMLVDSLFYTSDWGGMDRALERRSASAPSTYQENWGDSPNPNGGTPGFVNEVSTDQTPPSFDELYAVDATTLQLVFSERISSSSATDPQNYQISTNRNIQFIFAKGDSVQLILNNELVSEQSYEVTASNISDIFGNTLSGSTHETTYLRIDEAQPRDIVINEIMYDPGSDAADFIELYNASDKNIDLGNWEIGDAVSDATISGNTQLLAGGYLILTGSDVFASTIDNAIYVSGFPAYNSNTPDAVYLKTDDGQMIDSLRYDQTWGGNDGSSLERKDPEAASNDASNWQTSSAGNGYSAGSQNTAFEEDTTPPEAIFSNKLTNEDIEVRFNEFIQLTNDLKFLQDGQELMIEEFDPANGNIVILEKPPAKGSAENGTTITVQNLSDVKGNTTQNSEVAIAQPLEPTEIVINEIMFNPLDDPDDNKADQGEYIELRNTQDHAISLEGLYFHDAPDEDGEVRELDPVITTAKWVPAQGKVLIHADPAPAFSESKVANFFDLASPDMQSIMRVDRSSLSLASSDDAIFISDSTGATIDSVFYDQSWHNPNIIDSRGIALERVSPSGPSDDDSNWGSSVNAKGGTPNKENSLYQENAHQQDENGISFNPNPFSPDDDGYEDNLFINYKLDQQDYLIKVRIYDRYGRLVRKLADGKQGGVEGQLIWDGRKNDGSRNRIGIYIVTFEAYDSASGADKSFKKTVVLARKLN